MIFKIRKNWHYSNNFIYKLFTTLNCTDRISYYVTFDKSSLYSDETNDKFDINKLFGFSNFFHHKNSYRFGWNCIDGVIQIYSYSYVNGIRLVIPITSINLDEEYKFIIKVKNKKCIFTIIDSSYVIKQVIIDTHKNYKMGYLLWPYFGGNKKAPHNISISMIENK